MIEKKNGIWWPVSDYHCRLAIEHEVNSVQELASICGQHRAVIQAGGNVGVFPKALSSLFEKVFTFEPDAVNYSCLVRNIDGIANITAFNRAVGDCIKKCGIHREDNNCGAHYLKDGDECEVMPIDDLAINDCDLIQLDIEGYELMALRGAQETIRASLPVIVCEEKGLGDLHGIKRGEIAEFLKGLGYREATRINRDVVYVPFIGA